MKRLGTIAVVLVAAMVAIATGAASSSSGTTPTYLVRAIFDNAGFAVPGEDVRIAGAPVGAIESVGLAKGLKAAVTIGITTPSFTPFHANATCAIRPQSLIGERYIDCEAGSLSAPALTKITSGSGSGSYYLPVTQTSSPIDSDIVQDIYQLPIRQRFGLILNELGTGLAAQGANLNAVIRRADPALGDTDKVLQILARQNRQLATLSTDSNAVLTPLAKVRSSISDFILQANTTSVASAGRAADISRSIQRFPPFLRALRPLMVSLGRLADQGTPLMDSLGQSASALGRQFQNLAPFARAARPSLIALGKSSARSLPALRATLPLAQRLNRLGTQAVPAAALLDKLLESLNNTGAIEQLMSLLFYGTSAANGFDADGHYVRAEPLVGSCTTYVKKIVPGCPSLFGKAAVPQAASDHPGTVLSATDRIAQRSVSATASATKQPAALSGLLHYLIGSKR